MGVRLHQQKRLLNPQQRLLQRPHLQLRHPLPRPHHQSRLRLLLRKRQNLPMLQKMVRLVNC
jgi:hypothetical protein